MADPQCVAWNKATVDTCASLQQHEANVRTYQDEIDYERRNPSGVVDLKHLHDAGELLQHERELEAQERAAFKQETGMETWCSVQRDEDVTLHNGSDDMESLRKAPLNRQLNKSLATPQAAWLPKPGEAFSTRAVGRRVMAPVTTVRIGRSCHH